MFVVNFNERVSPGVLVDPQAKGTTGLAAALASLPLTGRITSSRLLFATRHLAAGQTSGLAGITPQANLVLYMPGRDYAAIQSELTANGWCDETECLLVSSLGTPAQQLVRCSLLKLSGVSQLPAPVVMVFLAVENKASQDF